MGGENPIIEWKELSGRSCLKFIFKGVFLESDALPAIEEWKKAFQYKPGEKIILIWDCAEMKGYDTLSRIAWQSALKELMEQIDSIWLITNRSLIKVGARVMSIFASIPIKVVSSESQIQL